MEISPPFGTTDTRYPPKTAELWLWSRPPFTYGAESEQKMKRRVRTISGKPHTPRKLVKDQAITHEEAAKRVKLEAEGQDMYYTREEAMARAQELGCIDVHTHEMDGRTVYMPCYTHAKYEEMREMMAEDKREETVVDSKEEWGLLLKLDNISARNTTTRR